VEWKDSIYFSQNNIKKFISIKNIIKLLLLLLYTYNYTKIL